MKNLSLIPYVCGAGASLPGAELGALYCLEHGLVEFLHERGIPAEWAVDPRVHWNGPYGQAAHKALHPRGSDQRHEMVSWHCQSLAGSVEATLRDGHKVLTIGGDHSMAAGSITGAAAAFGPDSRIGLIWIDAHADINTIRSSGSKALHGMPVAALLGADPGLSSLGPRGPVIRPEDIVYAGLRDIDPGEYDVAASMGIALPSMDSLRALGVSQGLQDMVTPLASRCDHLVMSIDLDAFSMESAPATGSPVPGGFQPDEILPVLAGIVATYGVDLIEIVEFNPALDGAECTYDLIKKIILALFPAQQVKNL